MQSHTLTSKPIFKTLERGLFLSDKGDKIWLVNEFWKGKEGKTFTVNVGKTGIAYDDQFERVGALQDLRSIKELIKDKQLILYLIDDFDSKVELTRNNSARCSNGRLVGRWYYR